MSKDIQEDIYTGKEAQRDPEFLHEGDDAAYIDLELEQYDKLNHKHHEFKEHNKEEDKG